MLYKTGKTTSLAKLRIISCHQAWSIFKFHWLSENYCLLFFFNLLCSTQDQNNRHILHFVSLVHFNLEQPLLNFLLSSCQQLKEEETSSIKSILFTSCSQLFTMHIRTEWTWLIPSSLRVSFPVPLLFVFKEENNYIWHIIGAAVFCLPEVIYITKD